MTGYSPSVGEVSPSESKGGDRLFSGVAIGESMMRRSGFQVRGFAVGLCLLVAFFASCESRDKYVGVYQVEAKGVAKPRRGYPRAESKRRWSVASEF